MRKIIILFMAILVFTCAALGAEDAAGTWKATLQTPNGAEENTFLFKVDGGKVTGTVSGSTLGSIQIDEGKVEEDKISFSITSEFGVIRYSGTIKGDDMTMTLVVGDGQFSLDFNAKRVKS
jgi:hypothetical protein